MIIIFRVAAICLVLDTQIPSGTSSLNKKDLAFVLQLNRQSQPRPEPHPYKMQAIMFYMLGWDTIFYLTFSGVYLDHVSRALEKLSAMLLILF